MVNSTGFVQAPQVALPEVARTFEVPEVPTFSGVPQVPTTGGGFLAPSGPGQPATSLAPSGPGQPATSTVPSLSPSSGGGGGFGIDGSTLALGGGAAGLAAALGAAGQKENGGGGILSPENILSGLSKVGDLTKFTGDGSILDKFLPKGFDLTSLPENVVESVSNFLGLGGGAGAGAGAPAMGVGTPGLMFGPTAAGPSATPLSLSMPDVFSHATGKFTSDAFLSSAFNPGMAGGWEVASGLGGSIGLPAGAAGGGAGAGSMMAAFAPAAIALGGIMALKMSSQKDPGTLAAEAEQRFDQISATKSVAQKHGIQAAIDEFGYNQVLEYAPFFAPGAPGYTSPLLRDQRPDHAVLGEIPPDNRFYGEILEFVASNRGDAPLQGNTAELIKQRGISTKPSARMREEMDFVLKQMGAPEEHRDYGISSNKREFKKGLINALVDSGELTRIRDEHDIEYIKPGNYYESMANDSYMEGR